MVHGAWQPGCLCFCFCGWLGRGVDLYVGVEKAGYSVAEEMPVVAGCSAALRWLHAVFGGRRGS